MPFSHALVSLSLLKAAQLVSLSSRQLGCLTGGSIVRQYLFAVLNSYVYFSRQWPFVFCQFQELPEMFEFILGLKEHLEEWNVLPNISSLQPSFKIYCVFMRFPPYLRENSYTTRCIFLFKESNLFD